MLAGEAKLLTRDAAKLLAALGEGLRKKLSGRGRKFTAAEGLSIVAGVAESLLGDKLERRERMLGAARALLYGVHRDVLAEDSSQGLYAGQVPRVHSNLDGLDEFAPAPFRCHRGLSSVSRPTPA